MPFLLGGGGEPPTKFSKRRGGLDRALIFSGGCWGRGGDLFEGGCNFYIKHKLKSEIFNDKKRL